MNEDKIAEALLEVATSLNKISTGDNNTPSGFEALCMAIGGPGTPGKETLVQTIEDVGTNVQRGLSEVATSIDGLAAAIRQLKS